MAQVRTAVTAGVARGDKFVTLASTTGMLVDDRLIVGREVMRVNAITGLVARVQRGMDGTGARAHTLEGAVFGRDADFVLGPGDKSIQEGGGITYTAAGTIQHVPGIHIIDGTTLAMTLGIPSVDDEGLQLAIQSLAGEAHVLTATGGFDGAGASFDVGTFGGAAGDGVVVAVLNATWTILSNVNVTVA